MAKDNDELPVLVSATGVAAPETLRRALSAAGHILNARAGQLLLATGTRSDDVYLVRSGDLRVTLYSGDGREVVIRNQVPGDLFGEIAAVDGGRRSTSILAVAPSQLLVVSAAAFRAVIAATPESALWFANHLVARIRSLTERVFELSTLNVRSRLHSQLLRLCAAAGTRDNRATIDPAPTHEVLATMIGTHREAVTREFSYLATEGIVAVSRKRIEVLDVARLASFVRRAVGEEAGFDGHE